MQVENIEEDNSDVESAERSPVVVRSSKKSTPPPPLQPRQLTPPPPPPPREDTQCTCPDIKVGRVPTPDILEPRHHFDVTTPHEKWVLTSPVKVHQGAATKGPPTSPYHADCMPQSQAADRNATEPPHVTQMHPVRPKSSPAYYSPKVNKKDGSKRATGLRDPSPAVVTSYPHGTSTQQQQQPPPPSQSHARKNLLALSRAKNNLLGRNRPHRHATHFPHPAVTLSCQTCGSNLRPNQTTPGNIGRATGSRALGVEKPPKLARPSTVRDDSAVLKHRGDFTSADLPVRRSRDRLAPPSPHDVDNLSVTSLSNCSVASEVLARAKQRKENFWTS